MHQLLVFIQGRPLEILAASFHLLSIIKRREVEIAARFLSELRAKFLRPSIGHVEPVGEIGHLYGRSAARLDLPLHLRQECAPFFMSAMVL